MSWQDFRGITIVLICAGILVGLLSLQFIFAMEPTDSESLCRTDQPLQRAVLVLIDKTDEFSPEQQQSLRSVLLDVKKNLAQFERLAIHVIGNDNRDEQGRRRRIFSLCNPGQSKDVNKYYRNPVLAQQKYDNTFRIEFDRLLEDILKPGSAASSPIADSLFASVSEQEDIKRADVKRIYLFTDLLEFIPNHVSFYVGKATTRQAQQHLHSRTPAGANEWLHGASIEVFVLRRDSQIEHQNAVLIPTWRAFLLTLGARVSFGVI